jgi:hypothetical protein
MRKILQINKDAIFWGTVILWGFSNIITLLVWGNEFVIFSDTAFIMLFGLLIIAMRVFPKFNKWLNQDFWKERK